MKPNTLEEYLTFFQNFEYEYYGNPMFNLNCHKGKWRAGLRNPAKIKNIEGTWSAQTPLDACEDFYNSLVAQGFVVKEL
jgi:hypothetical protein